MILCFISTKKLIFLGLPVGLKKHCSSASVKFFVWCDFVLFYFSKEAHFRGMPFGLKSQTRIHLLYLMELFLAEHQITQCT